MSHEAEIAIQVKPGSVVSALCGSKQFELRRMIAKCD